MFARCRGAGCTRKMTEMKPVALIVTFGMLVTAVLGMAVMVGIRQP